MNSPARDLANDAHGKREHQAILPEESHMIFFAAFITRLRLTPLAPQPHLACNPNRTSGV
jgi:hypothetical protein